MLIVYTWHRDNIKTLVIFHTIDKSVIHRRSFANVVLGLAANKSKWWCCSSQDPQIPFLLRVFQNSYSPPEGGGITVITVVRFREGENRGCSFPKYCKPGKCSATDEKCQSCPSVALAVLLACVLAAGKISFSAVQIFRLRNSAGLKLMLGENSYGCLGFFYLFSLGHFLDHTACTATWTLTRFQGSCMKTGTQDGSR